MKLELGRWAAQRVRVGDKESTEEVWLLRRKGRGETNKHNVKVNSGAAVKALRMGGTTKLVVLHQNCKQYIPTAKKKHLLFHISIILFNPKKLRI